MEQWKAVKAQGHIESRPQPEGEAVLQVLECPKRVRVLLGGQVVADSARALLLRERGHLPVYYFPREDVRTERFQRTDHSTHCPRKGDATYYTVAAGERAAENAAWSYEAPSVAGAEALAGHLAFYWGHMDAWYEEDEEVFVHARDPFVRVDILPSARRVRVRLGGEALADSTLPLQGRRALLARAPWGHPAREPGVDVSRAGARGGARAGPALLLRRARGRGGGGAAGRTGAGGLRRGRGAGPRAAERRSPRWRPERQGGETERAPRPGLYPSTARTSSGGWTAWPVARSKR